MSRFRDSLILAIPHVIGTVLMIAALVWLPGSFSDWRRFAVVIGAGTFLIQMVSWLVPPFRNIQFRRLRQQRTPQAPVRYPQ